jgi:hypothetical protein
MTTLIERCIAANAQLDQIEAARRNANARALVQQRAKEWDEHLTNIRAARERANWMSLSPGDLLTAVSRLNQLRHNAEEALGRLKEGEDVSTLTADALWTRLLQSAAGAAEAFDDAVKVAWRGFVDAQGSLTAPAELQGQLAATPTNEQAMKAYRVVHVVYSRLVTQPMPRGAQDKTNLLDAMNACRAELAKMQHDVPAEVETFFRAVYGNTATLVLLTPGVLQWLADNGQLHRYTVRSAG